MTDCDDSCIHIINYDDAVNSCFAKSVVNEKVVLDFIEAAKICKSKVLDLGKQEMIKIPRELLNLPQLEHLILEGNYLKELPDNFFQCLPNLSWLDLRNNQIELLPSVYIANHQSLRNLLLQNNMLSTLPLELGYVATLNGLSTHGNPLIFPPPEIIQQGTQHILKFLRDMVDAKSDDLGTDSKTVSVPSNDQQSKTTSLDGDALKSAASLNKVSNLEKQQSVELKRKRRQRPRTSLDYSRMAEDLKLALLKDYKIKENAILQRRKNENFLKEWRDETNKMQMKKWLEINALKKERTANLSRLLHCRTPPYGQDPSHMRIMSSDERCKEDKRIENERILQQKNLRTQQQSKDTERLNKIYDLENRLKLHTQKMYERRKTHFKSAEEELLATREDLEIANSLRSELSTHMKDLQTTI